MILITQWGHNMENINLEYIKTLNPCRSGLDNFIEHYKDFNGIMVDLLKLEKIPYDDKIWLATRVVDNKILKQWSLDCAITVVDNFNKEYPNDDRIAECLEVTSKYLLGESTLYELESAARAAAESAAESSAGSAYSAAARSAEYSAYSAAWAADSAAWAAWAADSAESAAWAARSAARSAVESSAAESSQEDLNISLLIALL